MRRSDRVFADAHCEVRISGKRAVVFDVARAKYLHVPVSLLPSAVLNGARAAPSKVRDREIFATVALTVGLVLGNLALLPEQSCRISTVSDVAVIIGYIAISIAAHELAHVVVLRRFGRRVDRFGFKLNFWIFPAFYVRMNQTLLLARAEQLVVHGAGVFANLSLNAIVLLARSFSESLSSIDIAAHLVFITACWNLVPVLGSDGYRVLLALTSTDAVRTLTHNPWWVIALKLLSIALAVLAAARLVLFLWSPFHA